MVLILILTILLSIFIPYLMKLREMDRRTRCADNLKQIYTALTTYAASNNSAYPRVVYDEKNNPTGYTAFTGADDPNPFSPNSAVQPNDVTASLWLLVRGRLIDPKVFICPSSDGVRDPIGSGGGDTSGGDTSGGDTSGGDTSGGDTSGGNGATRRSNFSAPEHLSYSYSSPFSNAPNYRMDDLRKGDFALLADQSPGVSRDGDRSILEPAFDAPPLALSHANSLNHGRAGQNVLYTGYVRFEKTPYCAVQRDNIYTALSPIPLFDKQLPAKGNGFWGHDIGPAWEGDSYLVPTADDVASEPRPTPAPTTAPTTEPTTVTTTTPTAAPTAAPTTVSRAAPGAQPSSGPTTSP